MPFMEEIVVRLEGLGVGTFGTTIFAGSKAIIPPAMSPAVLTLTETGGSGSTGTQNDTAVEHQTMSIVARAGTMAAARVLSRAAYAAFGGANGLFNVTLSGTFYLRIKARQNPTDIGLDSVGRPMIAFNIDADKQPS